MKPLSFHVPGWLPVTALALIAALLGCFLPGIAEAAVRFDGTREAIEAPASLRVAAGDIERITMEVSVTGGTGQQPLFALDAGKMSLVVFYDAASKRVAMMSAANPTPRLLGPVLAANAPFRVEMITSGKAGWTLGVNGQATDTVKAEDLDPAFTVPLTLSLGDQALVGTINSFTMEVTGAQTVSLRDDGTLGNAFVPWLGTYIMDGGEISIPQRLGAGDGVTADPARHGLYKRERYLTLSAFNGGYALVFDWGGVLPLKADPKDPHMLVPTSPDNAWAGRLHFDSDSDHTFTAENVRSKPGVPFLEDGRRYVRVRGHFNDVTPGVQKIGDLFSKFPSGFINSRQGCYDISRMDLDTLETSHGGCPVSIFQAPPDDTTCYLNDEDEHAVVPCGWRYSQIENTKGGFIETFINSSAELERSRTTGMGINMNVVGLKVDANASVDRDREQMDSTESKQSMHVYEAKAFALVLDPAQVYLSYCFIKDVLRAAPGAKPPSYYSASYKNRNKDNCSGDLADPIAGDPAKFLRERYGTHFSYATTYGTRGRQIATYDATELSQLIGQGLNSSTAISLDVQTKIEGMDVKGGGGVKAEDEAKAADKVRSIMGNNLGTYDCMGGSSCKDAQPDRSHLVPIYLQLRPLDELLAPPFFDDTKITVDLRQKVRAQIADYLKPQEQRPRPPETRMYQATIGDAMCFNWGWILAKKICPEGKPSDALLDQTALAIFVIKSDNTAEFLAGVGGPMSLRTALSKPLLLPVPLYQADGARTIGLGFKLLPKGYIPGSATALLTECKDAACKVQAYITPPASSNAPTPGIQTAVVDLLAWMVKVFVPAQPGDEAFIPDSAFSMTPSPASVPTPLFSNIVSLDFPFRADSQQVVHTLLAMRDDSGANTFQFGTSVKLDEVDVAAKLGFPSTRAADGSAAYEDPHDLIDATSATSIPPTIGAGAWQILVSNDATYQPTYTVTYKQNGKTVRVASTPVETNEFQRIDMPNDATDIMVAGEVVLDPKKDPRARKIFEAPVKLEDYEYVCFMTYGDAAKQSWSEECYGSKAICPEDGCRIPPYAEPRTWRRLPPPPPPQPTPAVAQPQPPAQPVGGMNAYFSLSDANPSASPPQGAALTGFNQGGYVGRFILSYTLAGAPAEIVGNSLPVGQRQTFSLPSGASNVRFRAQANKLTGWADIFSVPITQTSQPVCFKTYGTVFSPQWNNGC